MNTVKNGKKKFDDNVWYLASIVIFLYLAVALVTVSNTVKKRKDKYVVTYKADNKIEYKSLKNGESHVLDFAPHQGLSEKCLKYYDYINPGDTITGDNLKRGGLMPNAWVSGKHGYYPRVSKVNGKELSKWIEMQQRDSVIRAMRQKQK